jgi:poly(A) polymerase
MDLKNSNLAPALFVAERLKDAGFTAYFAGGSVRDFLMKRKCEDVDVATNARPEQVEKLFEKTIPVGKQFGVILVVAEGRSIEVATFRREGGYQDGRHPSKVEFTDAKEDATRRDFTVNGLFYDPFAEKVLDFVGGQEDIKRKVIKAIGDPRKRFEEDKLRLMRAVRFASTLGFEVEAETWKAVKEFAPLIKQVSPERIRDEIVKIFSRPGAAHGFDLLSESGLMQEILPEIEAMKGVEQPKDYHPEGDVFVHTRLLMEKLEPGDPVLAMAALLHDVGKPPTFKVREGKPTFYEHAYVGAEMTRTIMKRLRFSNELIDAVAECVANHMKFADVQKMRAGKLKIFVGRPTFEKEMELHKIDCQSCHGMMDNYYFLKEKLKEYAQEELKPKPLLNGHDVLALGVKPGPEVKVLLEEAYILQLEGQISDSEKAQTWLKKKLGIAPQ